MSRQGAKHTASTTYNRFQEKRRQDALERQKRARQQLAQQARAAKLAPEGPSDVDLPDAAPEEEEQQYADECVFGPAAGLQGAELRQHYARQLMQPEWMADIPPHLATEWLVSPRPEGQRCVIITASGTTTSRTRTGSLLHRGTSPLPGGCPATAGAPGEGCVLDGVYHAPGATYYILDVMVWRGVVVAGTGAECRLFWLTSRVEEEGLAGATWSIMAPSSGGREAGAGSSGSGATTLPGQQQQQQQQEGAVGMAGGTSHSMEEDAPQQQPQHEQHLQQQQQQQQHEPQRQHQQQQGQWAPPGQPAGDTAAGGLSTCSLQLAPVWPATPQGLAAAGRGPLPYTPDGLLLRHREGHYVAGAPTPLALLWKDAACSAYLLDTDAAGVVPPQQQVVLAYQEGGGVATGDDPPLVLARLPEAFTSAMSRHLRPGRLLRFSLATGGLVLSPEGRPAGADLSYIGPANQRRGRADVMHKILFQAAARCGGLSWEQLLAAAQSSEAAAAAAAAEAAAGGATQEPAAAGGLQLTGMTLG